MSQVLYADHRHYEEDSKPSLVELLEKQNISCEYLNKYTIPCKLPCDAFWEDYYNTGKLNNYEILITHMGTLFNAQINRILAHYPHLSIILTSDINQTLKRYESTEKLLVCGYNPEIIIPFVKKILGESSKPKTR